MPNCGSGGGGGTQQRLHQEECVCWIIYELVYIPSVINWKKTTINIFLLSGKAGPKGVILTMQRLYKIQ